MYLSTIVQVSTEFDVTGILSSLLERQTVLRDINEVFQHMTTLLDTRAFRKKKVLRINPRATLEEVSDALGDLQGVLSPTDYFNKVERYYWI